MCDVWEQLNFFSKCISTHSMFPLQSFQSIVSSPSVIIKDVTNNHPNCTCTANAYKNVTPDITQDIHDHNKMHFKCRLNFIKSSSTTRESFTLCSIPSDYFRTAAFWQLYPGVHLNCPPGCCANFGQSVLSHAFSP